MQLDRKMLNRLLSLSDSQLQAVIQKLASEYGLDLSRFHVGSGDMAAIRNAIRNASDADLLDLGRQLKNGGSPK